jgi:putative SOS response-associated peptidase YedK
MCGRYAASRRPEDLVEEFEIDPGAVPDQGVPPDYNVAPTKSVYAVLERPPADAEDDDEKAAAVRQLRVLRWGLVPSWAKDPAIGNRLINARIETAPDKPAFRKAFARRRCLLPADGYFEWYGEKGRKQPFFIHPRDGGVLPMAGLYELWRDTSKADDDPQRWLWTAVVLTTEAPDDLGRIHDRMPLLVERDRWAQWLDPGRTDAAELRELLVPAAPGRLGAYPVSTEVNNVRNNGPQLVDPLPLEAAVGADAADESTLF